MLSPELVNLPAELFNKVVDAVAEELDEVARKKALENCSCLRLMRWQAQRHLFKAIVFNGNDNSADKGGAAAGWNWFNRWCTDDPDRTQLSSHCTTIYYIRGGDRNVTVKAQDPRYLLAFKNIENLCLACVTIDPLEDPRRMPMFGKCLGNRIQTLVLRTCTMDVNQLIGYLCHFPHLKFLEISSAEIVEAKQRIHQTPPKFRGALRLELSEDDMTQFLVDINSTVTRMEYNRIGIHGRIISPQEIRAFLSKSGDSLTHLLINSRYGPFDVSYLEKLEVVAIRSKDITSILPMVEVLPLHKISLLLFVPPGSFKWCEDWAMLDSKLDSKLTQTNRTSDNRLRFYMTTFHEDFSFDRTDKLLGELLPLFTERGDVHVDDGLTYGMIFR